MYTLKIINNYKYDCLFYNKTKGGDTIVNQNDKVQLDNMGDGYLTIPGMGTVNFIDLGEKKIDGYPIPEESWGVLVRTHTTEGYYRYEGGGYLELTINEYGSCTLTTTNGTLLPVSLPELTIN